MIYDPGRAHAHGMRKGRILEAGMMAGSDRIAICTVHRIE